MSGNIAKFASMSWMPLGCEGPLRIHGPGPWIRSGPSQAHSQGASRTLTQLDPPRGDAGRPGADYVNYGLVFCCTPAYHQFEHPPVEVIGKRRILTI